MPRFWAIAVAWACACCSPVCASAKAAVAASAALRLAAAIFVSMGRSPLVGIAAVFVGVGGGFSANLAVTALDPMLAGATQDAARLIDDAVVVEVTANWYFMIASTFLVTLVGWLVTVFVVEPRFDPQEVARQIAVGREATGDDKVEAESSGNGPLFASLASLVLVATGLVLLVVLPGAPLAEVLLDRGGGQHKMEGMRALLLRAMAEYATELEAVKSQHPYEPLRYKYPGLKFTYAEAMALLRDKGRAAGFQMAPAPPR